MERLWGLTEMFPESLRNGVNRLTSAAWHSATALFSISRSVVWVGFSSATLLVVPVAFEIERAQMDEMQKQQQRQVLHNFNFVSHFFNNPVFSFIRFCWGQMLPFRVDLRFFHLDWLHQNKNPLLFCTKFRLSTLVCHVVLLLYEIRGFA